LLNSSNRGINQLTNDYPQPISYAGCNTHVRPSLLAADCSRPLPELSSALVTCRSSDVCHSSAIPTDHNTAPYSHSSAIPTDNTAPYSHSSAVPTDHNTAPYSHSSAVPTDHNTAPYSHSSAVPTDHNTAPYTHSSAVPTDQQYSTLHPQFCCSYRPTIQHPTATVLLFLQTTIHHHTAPVPYRRSFISITLHQSANSP